MKGGNHMAVNFRLIVSYEITGIETHNHRPKYNMYYECYSFLPIDHE